MHWLKCVGLNGKDRLKNMRGMTLEVAKRAKVNGSYSAISIVYQFVSGPLWHEPSSLHLIGHLNIMARPLNLDDLLWITAG